MSDGGPIDLDEARKRKRRRNPTLPPAGDASSTAEPLLSSGPASRLVEIALRAGATFWRDQHDEPIATVPVARHVEHHRVRSAAFTEWLVSRFGETMAETLPSGVRVPGAVKPDALASAALTFAAIAREQPRRRTAIRSAWSDDRAAIWLDLGDDEWRAVRITATDGWDVVDTCPVAFLRPRGLQALPVPEKSGTIEGLRKFVNLPALGRSGEPLEPGAQVKPEDDDSRFRLFVLAMIGAMWPEGPYPITVLLGTQGGGKSTASTVFRRLVDPNFADLRSPPRDETDLLQAATKGRIVGIENVSRLSSDHSDMLCRISTGAGFGTRKLYSNDEEHLVYACNPVLLNAIELGAMRGDFASRAIVLHFGAIQKRKQLGDFTTEFQEQAPMLLGCLLDGLSAALRNRAKVAAAEHNLPRMADFAVTAMAAGDAFGWEPEAVMGAFSGNQKGAVEDVVEADPVGSLLRQLAEAEETKERAAKNEPVWQGAASELYTLLTDRASDRVRRSPSWPADAARLSGRLKRLEPALGELGITIVRRAEGKASARMIYVYRAPAPPCNQGD